MIATAEFVARRNGISRARQDEFAVLSHERALSARLEDEIVPIEVSQVIKDPSSGHGAFGITICWIARATDVDDGLSRLR
ncbi:hypothetical protein AB4Z52_18075 [Rhizobium sp. 2YAF20]|uniref:thiolase family protein n=1 Tax=Rhizobium sp. 2YAF20 TaxID=3233027 RepID=UPI003F9DA4F2